MSKNILLLAATRPSTAANNIRYNLCIGTCTMISIYCIIMVVLMQSGSIYGYGTYTKVTNSFIDKQIEEIVAENGFREEDDELTKVHKIYNWICNNITYPEDAKSHNKATEVLATGVGNCMGQSQLFYLLLQKSGMTDCEIIRFVYDGLTPTHVAVAVNINSQYYIADTTNALFLSPERYVSVVTQYGYNVSVSDYWRTQLGL